MLRVGREYFAYGTGDRLRQDRAGTWRAFTILRSDDLIGWDVIGGALPVPAGRESDAFWAPEVAEHSGRFFLYYSTAPSGRDERHRLHVAVADRPVGPFIESGAVLPDEDGFCIDGHPFRNPRDGRWYLFYARDYFTEREGTGLAVVRLDTSMLHPVESPRPVLRANADWQIYERDRLLYGRRWKAWHTVEGPCVVAHAGRYYCFYSGGNWQTHEYGVSYAAADDPLGPWSHAPEAGPVVLAQRAPDVLGPGHNSYVVTPDGRTELLVYHAWDATHSARRMCVDPLVWTPEGPRCLGPTTGPQRI